MKYLLMWLTLSGCSQYTLHHGNRIGLAAALGATACDWGHTRQPSKIGWQDSTQYYRERNVILGKTPSTLAVDTYFLSSMALTTVAWWLLPEKWRPFVTAPVAIVGVDSVRHNVGNGVAGGLCGFQNGSVKASS